MHAESGYGIEAWSGFQIEEIIFGYPVAGLGGPVKNPQTGEDSTLFYLIIGSFVAIMTAIFIVKRRLKHKV